MKVISPALTRIDVLQAAVITLTLVYALLIFTLFVIDYDGSPLRMSDSDTYQSWSVLVPIGYPIFLALIPIDSVPIVQFGIYVISVLSLFFAIRPKSLVTAAIASALLLNFTPAWYYAMFLLTESLTMSAILLHIAAVTWYWSRPNRAALIAIGATVAVAALIRPASYFLFASLVIVPLVATTARLRGFLTIAASATLIFAAGSTYSYVVRGIATQTLGGVAMYGHVAHLFDPNKSTLPENIKSKATELRDAAREKRRTTNTLMELHTQQIGTFSPIVHGIVGLIPPARYTELFNQLSRESILSDPPGYIKTVGVNFYAAYAGWSLSEIADTRRLQRERLAKRETPRHLSAIYLERALTIPFLPRLIILALFGTSILILLTKPFSALSLIGLYAASLQIGSIAFTSIATVLIPRYTSVVDTMIFVTIACGVGFVVDGISRARSSAGATELMGNPPPTIAES